MSQKVPYRTSGAISATTYAKGRWTRKLSARAWSSTRTALTAKEPHDSGVHLARRWRASQGRSQVLLCKARFNSLFRRFNSLFSRLGNFLAIPWKSNALRVRIPCRTRADIVFPAIFPSAREVPRVFGLEGAAAQLGVGMAIAGHPAR